ncbi:unnamed protein product [Camellia sinensis]
MRENIGEQVGFIVCFWLLLYGSCLGRFVVERNNLKVTSPDSLKGVHESTIGNFGVPQYGGTMVGTMVYAEANQKACKSFSDVDLSLKSKPSGLPIFLLADRGENANLDGGGSEAENPDLSPNITQNPKLNPVIELGIPNKLRRIGLQQAYPIAGHGGLHLPRTMRRLIKARHHPSPKRNPPIHDSESGLRVLDSDLVIVDGGEEEANGERDGGGSRGGGGDAEVLDADLLEIELGFFGFEGEEEDEEEGQDEEGKEGEEEEKTAATPFE